MFLTIFKFEIKYWLKNPSFYAYLFIFFLMALFSMAGASGAFGEGSASTDHIANSPMSIYGFTSFFNKLLLFILPAIVGNTAYKDYKSNFKSILFSYPISKTNYLFAKFASGFLIVSFIAFFAELGLMLGTQLPTVNVALLLPFDASPYLQTYFVYLIPNLFLFAVIVFSIVLLGSNIYTGFIAVILLWLLKEIVLRLAGNEGLVSFLIDPFGETAIAYFTRYWTASEQNSLPLPIHSIIFYNRAVWLLAGIVIFMATYRWFSFSKRALVFRFKTGKRETAGNQHFGSILQLNLIKTKFSFSFFQQIKVAWKLSQTDFIFIIKSGAFISLVIAGIIFIGVLLLQMNPQAASKTIRVTWIILGFPVFFFSFLIQILTFLYAGILIHRSRHAGFADLIAVTAVPNWVLLFSRFLALVKMQVLLLFLIMATGIAIQINSSYYHFEIGHYLFDLFVIHLIGFIIWALLSLFVQSILNNTYLGLFLLILVALGVSQLPSLGIESFLFRFNESPNADFFLRYSDMNGYGHALAPYFLYKFYWLIFGLFLCCATLFLWQRELSYSIKERFRIAKSRLSRPLVFFSMLFLVIFLCYGFYLFNEENKPANKELSVTEENNLLTRLKKQYEKYEHIQQPRITDVFVELDIFPATNSFTAKGKYTLVNKTNKTIDLLLIKMGYDEITTLLFDTTNTLIEYDSIFKFAVYKLNKGMAPHDSMRLSFTIQNKKNTLLTQHSNILKNGTYLKTDIFPRLGYFAQTVIKPPDDSTALINHYQSIDADVVNFEAILSTSATQTAISSGNLIKEWAEGGRRYFHYKTGRPIKFVSGFNSGEFKILKDHYKGVDLRIYYHPKHPYGLIQMMAGLKAAIDYNTSHFGAYQHKQAQIIEFARSEGSYATTAGNCIQISEIHFINDPAAIKDGHIDFSFYIAAHELTHQWWGNQVIPANALGATMITESVTEYITAKIYEKKYGKQHALNFLNIQRNRYLSGRANATEPESPLYLVHPDQSYVAYGKGAMALYTLSEFIGEEKLNDALKDYFNKVKWQAAPYTTSLELLGYLQRATSDSLQYLVTDLFVKKDKQKILLHFDKVR